MQACVNWVLITFGTQVINKRRPVRPVFPDYLSVYYDYDIRKYIARGANPFNIKQLIEVL